MGESRVIQEGQKGVRVHLVEVENGKRTLKETFDKVVAQDRIVEVGTKRGTAQPLDGVRDLVHHKPELLVEEEKVDFQVQERKNDKLPVGQTRVIQEGQKGVRVHLVEVENGKRTSKETFDKIVAQDRIVEVGTKRGTAQPLDGVRDLVHHKPELLVEEKEVDFQVQERKNDKLPAGQTRVIQEGQKGVRVHLVEVENGKRTSKETFDKIVAQDRIVEVGTAVAQGEPNPQVSVKPDAHQLAQTGGRSQEEKATQTEKDHLPNTGSESQMSALAAGLALLGLGTGLAATTRKKED